MQVVATSFYLGKKKKVFLRFLARAAVSLWLEPSLGLSPPPLVSSKLPPWPTVPDFGHRPCNVCSTFWVYFGEGSSFLPWGSLLSVGVHNRPFSSVVRISLPLPHWGLAPDWGAASGEISPPKGRRWCGAFPPDSSIFATYQSNYKQIGPGVQAWERFGRLSSLTDSFKPVFFKNSTLGRI